MPYGYSSTLSFKPATDKWKLFRSPVQKEVPHLIITDDDPRTIDEASRSITLTMSIVALAAKLARIDGAMTEKDLAIFWELFPVPLSDAVRISALFAEAHEDTAPPHFHARRIARIYEHSPLLIKELVLSFIRFAAHNGLPSQRELYFIKQVADGLGVDATRFDALLRYVIVPHTTSPYLLIGVSKFATRVTIKKAYHQKAKFCHPDSTRGKSIAKELQPLLAEYFALLTDAYNQLLTRKWFS